jgi:hypothetical protein
MASLVPGYEYDIFISYRHNDNHSGWVTEFVKALQEELATILKEPVSIYFDTNPHDGLLDTHNVDKSLEGKLKCLIFLPVISQTYCDPQSYAWLQEFCAFNKLAKEDQFGKDIKLGNGNVTSRILPVKIHELDSEDKALLENELGEVIRAIEFIFKSPGVNRPLTSSDNPDKNQHQTFYRDQINKVANAIKEILKGIKNMDLKSILTTSNTHLTSQIQNIPFRQKLIKRSVLRASLVYVLISIVLWKIAVLVSKFFNLRNFPIQLIILILVVLFPIAVIMAWLYEKSPQGIVRTDSIASVKNPFLDIKKKPFTSNTFIGLLMITIAALFLLFPNASRIQKSNVISIEKSIAVLPFINDSQDQENMYFINGIMDEVLNNLQAIKDLRVISRTSVEQYRNIVRTTIPEIARKLDVNYIVYRKWTKIWKYISSKGTTNRS